MARVFFFLVLQISLRLPEAVAYYHAQPNLLQVYQNVDIEITQKHSTSCFGVHWARPINGLEAGNTMRARAMIFLSLRPIGITYPSSHSWQDHNLSS
ncbi:hypothetical protein F5878DRAFT_630344 [Lentinula raphanica]|uniref:Secreted protein n=1 Tax=Lentinula raphanica TaxID=153919 RepID=A0AA38P1C8_9AGAR|nr:hypothetical protein F5878DRAFT_630344 [Lentinula raphanica]